MSTYNPHVVGVVMKEAVRRAIGIARAERVGFEVSSKEGYDGRMDDVFTTADRKAQDAYLRILRGCFPDFGVLAEEDGLSVDPAVPGGPYFTIDPIDGTKAFIRRQSHGVGSMVALVDGGRVVSAYVGDVNTQEVFGFRPDSPNVWRITDFEASERLDDDREARPWDRTYVLLRERESRHCPLTRATLDACGGVSIDGGSIGTWASRLWTGGIGALALPPSWETPWDSAPVVGVSLRLGYVFLRPEDGAWRAYEPLVSPVKYRREHDTLVVHRNALGALAAAVPVAP